MTKKALSLIRYICLIWLIIYLIISIFKFIQINIRINEKYGIVSKKFFVVGYTNESIVIDNILLLLDRTVFPHFNPFYRYTVPEKMSANIVFKTSFMDGKFSVTMNDGIITRDNFYEVLIKDDKFQHLYSEWVKKQVGIEDENVELYFNRAMCGSRVIGDNIYIDFDKITDLNNLEEQLCENTHNIYIRSNHHEQGVDVKIYNINDVKEVLNYADLIEKKIRSRIFIDTNHSMPFESNHLFICFLTQNGENDLDIKYDYDSNTKMYRYHNKDSEWIEYE